MNTFTETTRFEGRVEFAGQVQFPANSIGDPNFAEVASLSAVKQQHQYLALHRQAHGTAAVAERRVVHVARGDGEIVDFKCGATVACIGDSTITTDLRKNGTTVLSGTVQVDSGDVAYAKVAGTVTTPGYSAGDVLEVVQTVSAGSGTLGQGAFAVATLREAP